MRKHSRGRCFNKCKMLSWWSKFRRQKQIQTGKLKGKRKIVERKTGKRSASVSAITRFQKMIDLCLEKRLAATAAWQLQQLQFRPALIFCTMKVKNQMKDKKFKLYATKVLRKMRSSLPKGLLTYKLRKLLIKLSKRQLSIPKLKCKTNFRLTLKSLFNFKHCKRTEKSKLF